MGKRRHPKLLCIILLMLPVMSGCGISATKESSSQLGIDGYVYTAQQVDINENAADMFKAMGGYLYYRSRGNGSETDDLRRFPMEELVSMEETSVAEGLASAEQQSLPAGESLFQAGGSLGYILDYTVDDEGCLYYLAQRRDAKDVPVLRSLEGVNGYAVDEGEISYVLVRQPADGSVGYSVSLSGSPRSLALGDEGQVCVLMEDSVYCINGDGRLAERLPVAEGEWGELLEGEAGAVYYQTNAFNTVEKIVKDRQSGYSRFERMEGPCDSGQFSGSRQGLFYTGEDRMLYRYREKEDSWETVLRWGDSNLACNSEFSVLPLSEDRLAAVLRVPGSAMLSEELFYILTKTPVEKLPKKEILVMAASILYDELEQYVMEFNRNSEDYQVIIRTYGDLARLDAELVSADPPDLINLTYMDYAKYGQKDALEDLAPYLESSGVLDREDFHSSILDACTVKGRLVCIPDEIYCTTVIGRASQLGNEAGWSGAEAMAFAERFSQARLFQNNSFSAMIKEFFRDYILERFIDWERGECSFDGEEFPAFIKWAAEHSDGLDNEMPPMEALLGTMPKERLLDISAFVGDGQTIMNYRVYFGEEVTAIGYPTVGGEAVHHGTAVNPLGIVAASGKKDGAWQFIEAFLSRENGNYTFLPARQDRMEENLAKLAQDGQGFFLPDGTKADYRELTKEELEKVYAVIDKADFTPREGIRDAILNIIVEEMSPCLAGTKTYEEAADIVQNRVKNMLI